MINPYKKLDIPRVEKQYIMPEPRQKLFIDLISEYEKRYPELTLLYASLNQDPEIPVDYVLIFSTFINGKEIIMFETPFLYSDRTIPGYRYCKREGIEDVFFEEAINLMTKISYEKFVEYINVMLELSVDHDSPLCWKRQEHITHFTKGLLNLSARYTKRE